MLLLFYLESRFEIAIAGYNLVRFRLGSNEFHAQILAAAIAAKPPSLFSTSLAFNSELPNTIRHASTGTSRQETQTLGHRYGRGEGEEGKDELTGSLMKRVGGDGRGLA